MSDNEFSGFGDGEEDAFGMDETNDDDDGFGGPDGAAADGDGGDGFPIDEEDGFGFGDDDEDGFGDGGEWGDGDGFGDGGDEWGADDAPMTMEEVLENQYREAIEKQGEEAVSLLTSLLDDEEEKTRWGFKSLKKLVKISQSAGDLDQARRHFERMMGYVTSKNLTMNLIESPLLNSLKFLSDRADIEELYELAMNTLQAANYDKARYRLMLFQGWKLLEAGQFARLEKFISELRQSCYNEGGDVDSSKNAQLKETLILEIARREACGQDDRLIMKSLYNEVKHIKTFMSARDKALVCSCGGKLYMFEHKWALAYRDFNEAFEGCDETAQRAQAICNLKYLVVACLLNIENTNVNPFAAARTKSYEGDAEIQPLKQLVVAFQQTDIFAFERVLSENIDTIVNEPFVKNYIELLRLGMRARALLKALTPYRRIYIRSLAEDLDIPAAEVERILVLLILDERLHATIDQVRGVIDITGESFSLATRYKAMQRWAARLRQVSYSLTRA